MLQVHHRQDSLKKAAAPMSSKAHTHRARALRKRATKAERILWHRLRGSQLGVKFRRQVPLEGYIVDFVCFEKKVIVELDGSQHAAPAHRRRDTQRDAILERLGFRVLRFWNHEIYDSLDAVLNGIYEMCVRR